MEDSDGTHPGAESEGGGKRSHLYLVVLLFAAITYLGTVISPPSLMDDTDAVQAQMARGMVVSHDWVTARLDGVPFLEKPPLTYWMIAASYKIFGVHDWSARIPTAISAIVLCWLTMAFGIWGLGKRAGFYAGLCMATCVGIFLFTRVLIPDVTLTFTVAIGLWAFLRLLDDEERHPRLWAAVLGASMGVGLLLKSMIAVLFPVATGVIYLAVTRQLFSVRVWKRLHPFTGALIALVIAAPWHILAALRNPPLLDFTPIGGPGQYHGFLWFFFYNDQVLRFLNLRYPRDYNTVPRLWFWLLHLVWLFPWSVYLPAAAKVSFKPVDRAGRTRLLALCCVGFVLIFFTFSTTQEYYSMPAYPALALLLGSAMAADDAWIHRGTKVLSVVAGCAALVVVAILVHVRSLPTPGDISAALTHHPGAYTLSLGHMQDLTLDSFAYLRLPLLLAAVAFLVGTVVAFLKPCRRAFVAAALMMVLFFQAARLAMVTFDPYLSSRPLARALMQSPPGKLITQGFYYQFSSVFFYANRDGLLLNDRKVNLEYGSNAPGAPQVFLSSAQFKDLWLSPERCYLFTFQSDLPRYEALVGAGQLQTVAASGGKILLTNHELASSASLPSLASSQSN